MATTPKSPHEINVEKAVATYFGNSQKSLISFLKSKLNRNKENEKTEDKVIPTLESPKNTNP